MWEGEGGSRAGTHTHTHAHAPLHPPAYARAPHANRFFATKTDASVLRMLNGSPAERLLKPIEDYVTAKGGRIHLRAGCK